MSSSWTIAAALPHLLDGFSAQFDSLGQWVFFKLIFDHLDHEIVAFRDNMMHRMTSVIGAVAMTLATLWIVTQGYRVMTGQSRESMMSLLVSSLRVFLILTAATSATFVTGSIHTTLTQDLPRAIGGVVIGSDKDPAEVIDSGLTKMQLAMAAIEALPALDSPAIKEDKDRALLMTGIGVAGPAVIGGALLMMYKFAIALFIAFSPLFILSLMFERTKSMFARWLQYGLGTMFSMAVLSFTVTVAMKMVAAVAASFATQYLTMMALGAGDSPGVNTMALQQGGLGVFLTVLILSVPPMASSFFQGALGNFVPQSIFGNTPPAGRSGASGTVPPNSYKPESPRSSSDTAPASQPEPRMIYGDSGTRQETGTDKPMKSTAHASTGKVAPSTETDEEPPKR